MDDLYSLDAAALSEHQPIHAFIFLFKWVQTQPETMAGQYDRDFPGFFAHQVVNNACATLAVMNALGNIPSLTMSNELTDLIAFTTGMDPQTRGLVITSSDWLREAHNALSPPSSIALEDPDLKKTAEDAYHFIVYLPFMGSIYELDGLKEAPVSHGPFEEKGEGWVAKARCVHSYFFENVSQNGLVQRSYRGENRHVPGRIGGYPSQLRLGKHAYVPHSSLSASSRSTTTPYHHYRRN